MKRPSDQHVNYNLMPTMQSCRLGFSCGVQWPLSLFCFLTPTHADFIVVNNERRGHPQESA